MKTKAKRTKKAPKISKEDLRIMTRMQEIKALLLPFGASLSGYDPGVSAYLLKGAVPTIGGISGGDGYFGEPLSFTRTEWTWLEPILQEVISLRQKIEDQERELEKLHAAEIDRIRW